MYKYAFSYFTAIAEKNYPWIVELQSEGLLRNPRTDFTAVKNVSYYPEKTFDESVYRKFYYKLPDADVSSQRNKFYRIVRLIFASILNANDFFSSLALCKNKDFSEHIAILKSCYSQIAFETENQTVRKMLTDALNELNSYFPNVLSTVSVTNKTLISKYLHTEVKDITLSQPMAPEDFTGSVAISKFHTEENTMSNVLPAYENQTVSNPTLIYGRPKEDWTENQLVSKIRELQKELNSYNDLASISKRFENKQNALKKDIATLVEILDSLE